MSVLKLYCTVFYILSCNYFETDCSNLQLLYTNIQLIFLHSEFRLLL